MNTTYTDVDLDAAREAAIEILRILGLQVVADEQGNDGEDGDDG
jgi:hypothetical protein